MPRPAIIREELLMAGISRASYAQMFGPTVGDSLRLAARRHCLRWRGGAFCSRLGGLKAATDMAPHGTATAPGARRLSAYPDSHGHGNRAWRHAAAVRRRPHRPASGTQYPLYPVHLAWVASVLLMLVHFWWWQFGLYGIANWTFGIYLFVLLYAVAALSALAPSCFRDSDAGLQKLQGFLLSRAVSGSSAFWPRPTCLTSSTRLIKGEEHFARSAVGISRPDAALRNSLTVICRLDGQQTLLPHGLRCLLRWSIKYPGSCAFSIRSAEPTVERCDGGASAAAA